MTDSESPVTLSGDGGGRVDSVSAPFTKKFFRSSGQPVFPLSPAT